MMALLHRIGPRVWLLVLLAVALGCFFFLFDLFIDLTSTGSNNSSGDGPSSSLTFKVPSGVSLISTLATVACIVLGAGGIVLFRRWLKDRPGTPRWVMACAMAPAASMVGLGIYLFVSGALLGSLPYGGVPYTDHQIESAGMNPWVLTLLITIVLSAMLVGVTRSRFSILPLALCLAAILVFGLLGLSAVKGLNLFKNPTQMEPTAAYTEEVNALRQRGPAAAVTEALAATDPKLTATAVEGLMKLGVPEAAAALARTLADADPELVATAVEALGELGDPEASATLTRALSDVDPEVMASVAEAFADSADPGDVTTFAEALSDIDPEVVAGIVEALADSGDTETIAALAGALADVDQEVLTDTVETLAESSDPETMAALAEALASVDEEILADTVEALAESGNSEALGSLAEALADTGGSAAIGPLAAAAFANDPDVRKAAVEALGKLDNPEALASVAQALSDAAPEVRQAAEQALAGQGATVSPLETGGSLVSLGNVPSSVSPGTTTRQAGGPSHTPVFRVKGAARVRYLRTGVGDVYTNGSWTQMPQVELPYNGSSRVRELVSQTLPEQINTGLSPPQNAGSALLAWPAEGLGKISEPDEITVSPVPPAAQIPGGVLPISLHLDYVQATGAYRPFSATFRSETSLPEVAWTVRLPVFTSDQLERATTSPGPAYIQLPHNLPQRIRQLARSITDEHAGVYRKAKAIETFLRGRFTYAFATPDSGSPPPKQDPVDWFLFDSKTGTCGQFSSAFVVLARSVGIPARVVSGWAVSPVEGLQTIHTDQAHQWAEVAFNELGWVTFEPTAPGGAPSRTPGFGNAAAAVEEAGIDPKLESTLESIASENPGLAAVISGQVDLLTSEGSPVVDQLAERLTGDRQWAGESAEETLQAMGASVTRLENGGSAIDWGDTSSWVSGTATEQAEELPATPLFQVTGGPGDGYLRTATGDIYADGRWAQADLAEVPYKRGADLASLVAGWDSTPSDSSQQVDSHKLPWPGPGHGRSTGSNNITVSAHPMVGNIPGQGMPISQGVEQVSVNGSYDPLSGTFSSEGPLKEYAWVAREVEFSRDELVGAGAFETPAYIQLPDNLPQRIGDLARSITGEHESPYLKAEAIETFLREEYTYAFAGPESESPPTGQDPVDWFLFDSKPGTSGQFSSAFTVLARSVGIPARVVSGWAVGETDETRTVFSNQAHQWAEVALQDVGWTSFDPTPAGGAPERASEGVSADGPLSQGAPSVEDTVTKITEWPTRTRLGHPFTIGGTVISSSGVTIDGMEMEVFINKKKEQGGVLMGLGVTNQGQFSVEIQLPRRFAKGDYQLIAHALGSPGYAESWSDPGIGVYSGTRFDLKGPSEISAGTPVEFHGRLSEETGGAVAHQEVLVKIDGVPLPPVMTNARGEFSFGVSFDETGTHSVTVEMKDTGFLLGSTGLLDAPVTMPTLLELDELPPDRPGEEFSISGKLRDHFENPLGGQTVELTIGEEATRSVVTDSEGNFSVDQAIRSPGTHNIKGNFSGDDSNLEPSQISNPVTVGEPEIAVKPLEPVGRDGELVLEGTVSIGGEPVPDAAVTVDGEEVARTDANGAFSLDYPVPPDASLGDMPLEVGVPELDAETTVQGEVKSDTNLVVTPLEQAEPGGSLLVGAQLLDEQGKGIPNAAIHYGADSTAITGPDGIAKFELPNLEGTDPSENPLSVRFEGNESNLPKTVEFDGEKPASSGRTRSDEASREMLRTDESVALPSSSEGGFNWQLWIGVPLGLVLGCVVAFFAVRAGAGLLSRSGGLPAFRLSAPRRRARIAGEEGERIPALLDLIFPGLPDDGGKLWQVGERVSLRCVLTGESGEPLRRAVVELDWGGSGEPVVLTTDRRGRCMAGWSGNAAGTYIVTAHFAGDGSHQPVTASAEFRLRDPYPGHLIATHIDLVFVKPAEDLPNIWGIGEQVNVDITLTDVLGESVSGRRITATMGGPGRPLELVTDVQGRCSTAWAGDIPGTYMVDVNFGGDDRYAPISAQAEFEVVDFREEVVRRYNSFLPWVRERDLSISDQATPREMEVMVVTSGIPIDQRALEVVIARFEEADYSLHEIDRPRFEAMYRARRAIVGD